MPKNIFDFDCLKYDYSSRRTVTFGRRGMVATSQNLAASAGLDILKKGGNAVDAAIATAACLSVVEPTSNGIGGDAFSIIYFKDKLYGINGSGFAPELIDREKIINLGYKEMPIRGWIPVMVPGVPATWAKLSKRFGNLKLSECLEPAIYYAHEGFPVSPIVSKLWENAFNEFKKDLKGEEFEELFKIFTDGGKTPKAGDIWKLKSHAKTLEIIGKTNAEDFYKGELAEKIDAFSKKTGGYIRKSDLEKYETSWVNPVSINYRGYDIWEIPPNGDGIIALMALNILKEFELGRCDDLNSIHQKIEAMKLAFADGNKYIADKNYMNVSVEELLSDKYAKIRKKLITEEAMTPSAGSPKGSSTVYIATADSDGNMVSYIQSNYKGFGSGIVVPGTGIALQDRGANFSLDEDSVNAIAPFKKSFHTIIPGFITKDSDAIGPFGVMGEFMQPQGHLQVVSNLIDYNMNPQAALDAPRWQWIKNKKVLVEKEMPEEFVTSLLDRGHDVEVAKDRLSFGRGQIILKKENGAYAGGTEPRTDGCVASW